MHSPHGPTYAVAVHRLRPDPPDPIWALSFGQARLPGPQPGLEVG